MYEPHWRILNELAGQRHRLGRVATPDCGGTPSQSGYLVGAGPAVGGIPAFWTVRQLAARFPAGGPLAKGGLSATGAARGIETSQEGSSS